MNFSEQTQLKRYLEVIYRAAQFLEDYLSIKKSFIVQPVCRIYAEHYKTVQQQDLYL